MLGLAPVSRFAAAGTIAIEFAPSKRVSGDGLAAKKAPLHPQNPLSTVAEYIATPGVIGPVASAQSLTDT
jgi:hypothetical protein